jgi:hypothetical protein
MGESQSDRERDCSLFRSVEWIYRPVMRLRRRRGHGDELHGLFVPLITACSFESSMVTSTARPDGQVGLRTFGMTAWFDYIFVVEPRPR